jgi:signal transduction histidine kinase
MSVTPASINQANSKPAFDEDLAQRFVSERTIDTWLASQRSGFLGRVLCGLVLAAIWWGHGDHRSVMLWTALMLAALTARFFFTEPLLRMRSRLSVETRIGLLMLSASVLVFGPLMAFDRYAVTEQTAITIILLTLATASVISTAGLRMVFLYYSLPMLLPLSLAWAMSAQAGSSAFAAWGLSLLILLYQIYLIGLSRKVGQVFLDAGRYRYAQSRLNVALQGALDAAEEANRAKTQFLAAASHDLRQPMHSMNVLVAALSLKTLDESSQEIVRVLDTVNQTITQQLDGLLDISKLDAGTVVPTMAACRLDNLLRAHYQAVRVLADDRGQVCTLTIEQSMTVRTDEALLRRAISNLTDNALKFTPSGGQVMLTLTQRGSEALIEVSDSGIGIPDDQHELIFREFYQIGNANRDRARGLGLGLSIVRRLCDLIGARLSVHSVVGMGSRFTISLPLIETDDSPQARPVRQRRPLQSLVVLVIDDEMMVRQSMKMLLETLGCKVHVATGSSEAVQIAAGETIDVILSDMRLAEGDSGIEAIAQVRTVQPQVRAVLVTGDTAPQRLRDAQATGLPLLHKPVTLDRLLNVLDD